MKNILITGAKGQLGQKLYDLAVDFSSLNIIACDLPETDITDKKQIEKIFTQHRIDLIVNCAAYTAVDKAEDDAENAYKVNAFGPGFLAEIASQNKIKLIHISTDYVFDGSANTPYTETDIENPVSVYGKSKLEGEKLVLSNAPESVIIRTSWLYSEYGHNFAKTILRLATQKQSLNVVFDQVGTPTYAGSLANAILTIANNYFGNNLWQSGIYHYSDLGVCSWYDFAVFLLQENKIATPVFPVRSSEFVTKAQRPAYSVLDKRKIVDVYGIKIPYWTNSCRLMLKKNW